MKSINGNVNVIAEMKLMLQAINSPKITKSRVAALIEKKQESEQLKEI